VRARVGESSPLTELLQSCVLTLFSSHSSTWMYRTRGDTRGRVVCDACRVKPKNRRKVARAATSGGGSRRSKEPSFGTCAVHNLIETFLQPGDLGPYIHPMMPQCSRRCCHNILFQEDILLGVDIKRERQFPPPLPPPPPLPLPPPSSTLSRRVFRQRRRHEREHVACLCDEDVSV